LSSDFSVIFAPQTDDPFVPHRGPSLRASIPGAERLQEILELHPMRPGRYRALIIPK
jgi:hypothetical protein